MESPQSAPRGRIVAIGNFDGVHRGHQAVLRDAASDAARRALRPAVLTFSPHPAEVLGRTPPPLLTGMGRKLELIARVSPEIEPVVERFDRGFAAQSPAEFAERVLAEHLGAKVVMVGHNFRFGHARAGDLETLTRLGERFGFETLTHPLVGDAAGPWSSTRIRGALQRGELDAATEMLGRPHMLSGAVVHGDHRGRTIGFPTCNLGEIEEALPPWGVYAVLVDRELPGSSARAEALAKGVANIGVRPTVKVGEPRPSVEVHLFDWTGDLYGERLRVHLVARLRPEKKFGGLGELKAQIGRDAEDARSRLDALAQEPSAGGAFR